MRVMRGPRKSRAGGFSLIEVLMAILVLAIGLLGFALTQTMSLRFATGANQRTQATNLAYDLLDQIRANRLVAAQYQGASFASGSVNPTTCERPLAGAMSVAQNIERWRCQAARALGPEAAAQVAVNNGVVTVSISWNEERWSDTSADTQFEMRSRL